MHQCLAKCNTSNNAYIICPFFLLIFCAYQHRASLSLCVLKNQMAGTQIIQLNHASKQGHVCSGMACIQLAKFTKEGPLFTLCLRFRWQWKGIRPLTLVSLSAAPPSSLLKDAQSKTRRTCTTVTRCLTMRINSEKCILSGTSCSVCTQT